MEEIETYIQARYPLIYLVSWEEDRVLNTLDQVAIKLKKMLFVWTETRGLYNYVLPDEIDDAKADPEVVLDHIIKSRDNAVFVLLDFHAFIENSRIRRKLRDAANILRKSNKCIVFVAPSMVIPDELSKDVIVIDFQLPGTDELGQLFESAVNMLSKRRDITITLNGEIREKIIRASQGLTTIEFENVLAKSAVEQKAIDENTISAILEEKKQIIKKTGVLEYFSPEESFDQIGGLENLKEWLTKRADAFTDRAEQFGLPTPKGLLLIGVQGCGKSLSAKAVASLWNLPLLKLDVGSVFSGVVGSSEHNMRHAIKIAESISPAILWIDEIEKGFSGIASSNFSDAGTAARVFATFTTWLQEKKKPVFVIATANNIDALPPELLRKGRFDEIFFVDLPEFRERLEIVKIHLKKRNRAPADFDCESLATNSDGFSGAEIEQVIVSALYDAFELKSELKTEFILENLKSTVPLSRMMVEMITALRSWAEKRARRASTTEPSDWVDRFSHN